MITAGIDVGAKTIKVVLLDGGKILAKTSVLAGFETEQSVEEAYKEALAKAGIERSAVGKVGATGAGRKAVAFAQTVVTEVSADAQGAVFLHPSARTVIDVGAEEGRGIKTNADGKVVDFAVNEKCAAGAGAFTESMARALEVTLAQFGDISLKSNKSIPMNAQCTVFAESEVVSLIHSNTSKEDIARAVHDAIASRISAMVRRVGLEQDVILVGGVAYNIGFLDSIKRTLGIENVVVPQDPEYVGALGAAVVAGAAGN
ncbi:MAG: CoA activase [Candidatus Tectomicrobia bacterium]|uniref:CoA activase n=1 Tax=Tectimicrobiota bacterium TaxID=2528274 RepID=A0A932GRU9_UNCTE|nr:CoA activase [Candidatus Tectomicrobia bacterium]